jgi:hypothetical protein
LAFKSRVARQRTDDLGEPETAIEQGRPFDIGRRQRHLVEVHGDSLMLRKLKVPINYPANSAVHHHSVALA